MVVAYYQYKLIWQKNQLKKMGFCKMDNFAERFRHIRKEIAHLNQKDFAKKVGIDSYQSIYKYEKGISYPKYSVLANIHNEYGVSMDWMISGVGSINARGDIDKLDSEIKELRRENKQLRAQIDAMKERHERELEEKREIIQNLFTLLNKGGGK